MPIPRFRVRTLVIVVAALSLPLLAASQVYERVFIRPAIHRRLAVQRQARQADALRRATGPRVGTPSAGGRAAASGARDHGDSVGSEW